MSKYKHLIWSNTDLNYEVGVRIWSRNIPSFQKTNAWNACMR